MVRVQEKKKRKSRKRRISKVTPMPKTITLKRRRLVSRTQTGPAIKNEEFVKMRNFKRISALGGDLGGSAWDVNLWDAYAGGSFFGSPPFGWATMQSRYHDYRVQAVKIKVIWKPSVAFTVSGLTPQDQILMSRFDGGGQELRTNDGIHTFGNKDNKVIHSDIFYWDTALTGTDGQSAWSHTQPNKYFKAYRKPIFDLDKDAIMSHKEHAYNTSGTLPSGVPVNQGWTWHMEIVPADLSLTSSNHYVAYVTVDYYCSFYNPKDLA